MAHCANKPWANTACGCFFYLLRSPFFSHFARMKCEAQLKWHLYMPSHTQTNVFVYMSFDLLFWLKERGLFSVCFRLQKPFLDGASYKDEVDHEQASGCDAEAGQALPRRRPVLGVVVRVEGDNPHPYQQPTGHETQYCLLEKKKEGIHNLASIQSSFPYFRINF